MVAINEALLATMIGLAVKAMPSKPETVGFKFKKNSLAIRTNADNFDCLITIPLKEEVDKVDRISFALETNIAGTLFNKNQSIRISLSKKGNVIFFKKIQGNIKKSGRIESVELTDDVDWQDSHSSQLPSDLFITASKLHKLIQISPLFGHPDPNVIISLNGNKGRVLTADNHHMSCVDFPVDSVKKENFSFMLPKFYMNYFDGFGNTNGVFLTANKKLEIHNTLKECQILLSIPSIAQEDETTAVFENLIKPKDKSVRFSLTKEIYETLNEDIIKNGIEDIAFHIERKECVIKGIGKGYELSNKIVQNTDILKSISFSLHMLQLKEALSIISTVFDAAKEKFVVDCVLEKSTLGLFFKTPKRSHVIMLSLSVK